MYSATGFSRPGGFRESMATRSASKAAASSWLTPCWMRFELLTPGRCEGVA
jgi:hypothetical protein